MVEVCGVRFCHPLASASSKDSLKRKNSSSVALQIRRPRSAARSSWRRRIRRGDTSMGAPCSSVRSQMTKAVPGCHGISRAVS